jgi:hypothetical protein
MDFYEEASLVMVPSGYKDQKVYSSVPDDGSGDLTFTRASNATRVGPDELIEKVRTNLITYSEDFGNAAWVKTDCTVTTNTTANPINGALTADTIVFAGADDQISQTFNVSNHTLSVYIKGTAGETITIGFGAGAEITHTLTGGFDRVSVTGSSVFFVYIGTFSGATARTIIVYGAQLETGDIATDYIATTTAAVSVGPVANVPRLDYLDSSSPRLLLEPQRTNLITFSDGFTNGWTASGGTITATANYGISPDGYQNSTRIQFASANLIWRKSVVGLTGNVGTFSLYIKGTAGQTLNITYGGVDLLITLGSGWNRYSVTATGTINEVFLNTFSGSTAQDIEVYGGQAELGSYATSYIPTLGASVTRLADAASKTGISSLIGQTEGTMFAEFNIEGDLNASRIVLILSSVVTDDFVVCFISGGLLYARIRATVGGTIIDITKSGLTSGVHKVAIGYAANDLTFYLDGVLVGQNTSVSVAFTSPLSIINLGQNTAAINQLGDGVAQALLFPTRLSNADLATLTTL